MLLVLSKAHTKAGRAQFQVVASRRGHAGALYELLSLMSRYASFCVGLMCLYASTAYLSD